MIRVSKILARGRMWASLSGSSEKPLMMALPLQACKPASSATGLEVSRSSGRFDACRTAVNQEGHLLLRVAGERAGIDIDHLGAGGLAAPDQVLDWLRVHPIDGIFNDRIGYRQIIRDNMHNRQTSV